MVLALDALRRRKRAALREVGGRKDVDQAFWRVDEFQIDFVCQNLVPLGGGGGEFLSGEAEGGDAGEVGESGFLGEGEACYVARGGAIAGNVGAPGRRGWRDCVVGGCVGRKETNVRRRSTLFLLPLLPQTPDLLFGPIPTCICSTRCYTATRNDLRVRYPSNLSPAPPSSQSPIPFPPALSQPRDMNTHPTRYFALLVEAWTSALLPTSARVARRGPTRLVLCATSPKGQSQREVGKTYGYYVCSYATC